MKSDTRSLLEKKGGRVIIVILQGLPVYQYTHVQTHI